MQFKLIWNLVLETRFEWIWLFFYRSSPSWMVLIKKRMRFTWLNYFGVSKRDRVWVTSVLICFSVSCSPLTVGFDAISGTMSNSYNFIYIVCFSLDCFNFFFKSFVMHVLCYPYCAFHSSPVPLHFPTNILAFFCCFYAVYRHVVRSSCT